MSTHTSMHGANACVLLPKAACIEFQILVLAQKTERISGPFTPGSYPAVHASQCLVFCHRPLCPFFPLLGWSALHKVSTIVSPGSLNVQWPYRLIQTAASHKLPQGNLPLTIIIVWEIFLCLNLILIYVCIYGHIKGTKIRSLRFIFQYILTFLRHYITK